MAGFQLAADLHIALVFRIGTKEVADGAAPRIIVTDDVGRRRIRNQEHANQ
jgi:hypothetical protein